MDSPNRFGSLQQSLHLWAEGADRGLARIWAGVRPRLQPITLVPIVVPIVVPIAASIAGPLQSTHVSSFPMGSSINRVTVPRAVMSRAVMSIMVDPDPDLDQDLDLDRGIAKIYNAERRLQLAHAINDRSSIALIRAELARLL